METKQGHRDSFDLRKKILRVFALIFISSPARITITAIILICQFVIPGIIDSYADHVIDNSAASLEELLKLDGLKQSVHLYAGLVKWLLLFCIVIAPVGGVFNRSHFKRLALGMLLLWLWFCLDVITSDTSVEHFETTLQKKSFEKNKIEVFAKIVFASYIQDTALHKNPTAILQEVSTKATSFVTIVKINAAAYPYPGLLNECKHFNELVTLSRLFYYPLEKGIQPYREFDLRNCLLFSTPVPHHLPPLPEQYVKIFYDPVRNGIELYRNTHNNDIPVWDSIPRK